MQISGSEFSFRLNIFRVWKWNLDEVIYIFRLKCFQNHLTKMEDWIFLNFHRMEYVRMIHYAVIEILFFSGGQRRKIIIPLWYNYGKQKDFKIIKFIAFHIHINSVPLFLTWYVAMQVMILLTLLGRNKIDLIFHVVTDIYSLIFIYLI